jgi:hypothetical protein
VSHNNAVDGVFNWQNDSRRHHFNQTTTYHNGEFGLDHGAYLNTYQFNGLTSVGNGEGGINLRAATRANGPPLSFTDVLVDGEGISEYGIIADDHTLPPENGPTRLREALLRGAREADLRMAPADEPYSLAATASGLGRWSVEGGETG